MKFSIIIPVLNESDQVGSLIQYLKRCLEGTDHEIIIADGGSDDATVEIAGNFGAAVVECGIRGRAAQMNRGAEKASGDVFFFLHADSLPPVNFLSLIQRTLQERADAGCFRLQFDDPHPLLRFYSWFTRFDVDIFRFGDQSLFIKKEFFKKLNGFDEQLVVMEDQEIVKRIKKKGGEFAIVNEKIVTSARKYKANGMFRLQLIFTLIVIFYYCGASQETLVHLYKSLVRTRSFHPSP